MIRVYPVILSRGAYLHFLDILVKCLPFGRCLGEKAQTLHTWKIQVCISRFILGCDGLNEHIDSQCTWWIIP